MLNDKIEAKTPRVYQLNRSAEKSFLPLIFLTILVLTWFFLPRLLHQMDQTTGSIDQSIWLLILLSLISFLIITATAWWLLKHFWSFLGLPAVNIMVSQFNILSTWQQLGFYWASFFLLLLAALGCLNTIC